MHGSFTNENGLRVQKTVNGVATKYTLHGKNVVHMTSGTDELHFFYDAQNRPAVVVYNGTAYAYVKNLQGDIVAILDEMAIQSSATATMRGARRCGAPVNWRKRWARCSRLGIAGMCLMRKRGCTISGVGTIIRGGDGLLMRIC